MGKGLGNGVGAEGRGVGQGRADAHLVVDVLARRRAARGQDVVVVAVVDDQDAPRPHHAGDVPQGQLVVALVPCGGNRGVPRQGLCPRTPRTTATPLISPVHKSLHPPHPPALSSGNPQPHPGYELRHVLSLAGAAQGTHSPTCGTSLGVPAALPGTRHRRTQPRHPGAWWPRSCHELGHVPWRRSNTALVNPLVPRVRESSQPPGL